MGFEIIARAFGSKVTEMDEIVKGFKKFAPNQKGQTVFGKDKVRQYEAHKWRVKKIDDKHFEVLAESPTGLEIIRHKSRPIIATQFHPEKGGTLSVKNMMVALGL
jgi:anthranilate/para-aminobenzoate synthase component II